MTSPDPMRRLQAALEDFPQQLARATEAASSLAEQVAVGRSASETVEVGVTGAGQVVAVRLLVPKRDLDSQTLGEDVRDAANAALDAADALRAELAARLTVTQPRTDARGAFSRRIDTLLGDLGRISSQLDTQLAGLTASLPGDAAAEG